MLSLTIRISNTNYDKHNFDKIAKVLYNTPTHPQDFQDITCDTLT